MTFNIIFMSTTDFSIPTLYSLYKSKNKITAIYTKLSNIKNKNRSHTFKSPVQIFAEKFNIPIYAINNICEIEKHIICKYSYIDIIIVTAYGFKLTKNILNIPRFGCFNIHASILPKWRGAAPIQRAIMSGDKEIGVTIIKMQEEIDAGKIVIYKKIPISNNITTGEISKKLSYIGSILILKTLSNIKNNTIELKDQNIYDVTYAKKISKKETRINWNQSSFIIHKHICALSPKPGAWCEINNFNKIERIKILKSKHFKNFKGRFKLFDISSLTIGCIDGSIMPVKLQKSGGKIIDIKQFIRGSNIKEVF